MPSCSSRTTWYGPATSVVKYVASGPVGATRQRPGPSSVAGPLPATSQSAGQRTSSVDRRLEIGLVEAREPARRGVEEGHRVQVGAAVGRIDVPVQALAVVRVGHHRVDDSSFSACRSVEREPPGRRIEGGVRSSGAPFRVAERSSCASDVDEGRRSRSCGPEPDRRRRAEVSSSAVEVEVDVDRHRRSRPPGAGRLRSVRLATPRP